MDDERRPPGVRTDGGEGGTSRRRVLASLGSGVAAAALAGCGGAENGPAYERETVEGVEGGERSAEEALAAEALADREINENASELESLRIEDHEFVLEDGYKGPTVQGTLENTGDEQIRIVEVRVRVYDDAGRHLGLYLDSTGDLSSGSSWSFEVILLESPGDIGSYGVAALGIT